jgi:putative ABC transport system permease protein
MFLVLHNFLEALESLTSNKLRTALTMLGIIIGVGAVIAMLAVGQGAQDSITGSINSIGTNLVFVMSGGSEDVTIIRPLTLDDMRAIGDPLNAPSVQDVSATISLGRLQVSGAGKTSTTSASAVTASYGKVRNFKLSEGEFFTDTQLSERASVVILGSKTADNIFGIHEGLVGLTLRINGQPFRIVGIQASQGGSSFGNQDDQIYLPLTTAQSRFGTQNGAVSNQVNLILASASSAEAVPQAQQEIGDLLRSRHRTAAGKDDFSTFTQQDFLQTASQITGILTVFLGGIAAISLLVGGIGIMNIMLVSVTERTREIGLRKALGARKKDILLQFLTESATLSLVGGLFGILLGWGLAMLVGYIAKATGNDFSPSVGWNAILLATLFSAAVGLFFGIYPASRAAGLQPVEALRYE